MTTDKKTASGGGKKPAARRGKSASQSQASKKDTIPDVVTPAEASAPNPAPASGGSASAAAASTTAHTQSAAPAPTSTATPGTATAGGGGGGTGGGSGSGTTPSPDASAAQNPAYIAIGLAVVAVILAMTQPVWGPKVYGDPTAKQLATTTEMVRKVTEAVNALEETIPSLRTASGDRAARLEAIEERLEEIKLPSFLLAIGELRQALRTSEPFETELDVATAVTGADSDLKARFDEVADLAAYGVPTTRQLNRRFGQLAQRMFLVSQLSDDPTMTSRALARLNAVAVQVRVRFFGERPGNDVTAIISRIQARIDEGNLPKAIEELQRLPDNAEAVADGWVEDAQKRVRVNTLQGHLKTLMMQRAVAGNKS